MHSFDPGQTVCILSASQALCTIQQNIQKTKGSTEGGENEQTDQTINQPQETEFNFVCVCVFVRNQNGRQKARGGRGR